MAAIIDTVIPSNTDRTVLKAFFHGHIHGEYKLYRDDENSIMAISFTNEEDATVFKLKELDQVYLDQFHKDVNSLDVDDFLKQITNIPNSTQPSSPWVSPNNYPNHWYGNPPLIGDTFTSNGTSGTTPDIKWKTTSSYSLDSVVNATDSLLKGNIC